MSIATINHLSNKTTQQSNIQYFLNQILNIQGYTPNYVAKILNTSTTTIKNINSGIITQPRSQLFERIIRLYCSLTYQ